jgi:hypothetical protein
LLLPEPCRAVRSVKNTCKTGQNLSAVKNRAPSIRVLNGKV